MSDSVSFKAYLKRDGQEVEVRRFGIDGGAATSFMYLCSKIQAMFPSIEKDKFQVFWQDSDKDYIRIDSDEELLEALTSSNQQPLKVYVQVQNNTFQGGAAGAQHETHPGVVCDGCEGTVQGFRYKCVTCPDFDLCSRCESNGLHPEHFMLRMPKTVHGFLNQPKFLRKLFTHPHKFHKRHGWSRRGCGDSHVRVEQCPRGPMAGVTDMFDFSALMQFIESLGVANQPEPAREETANQSASTGETATPPPNTSQSSNHTSSDTHPNESCRATEYLNNIGQMVAAILDPLGVDVTFDVRTKTSQQQPQTASTSESATTVPTASQTDTTPPTVVPPGASHANPTPPTIVPPAASLANPTPPTIVPPGASHANPTSPVVFLPTASNLNPTPPTVFPPGASHANPTPPLPDVSSTGSQTQTELVRERRNSDGWTVLTMNQESPTQNQAASMEVDESQGVKPKTMPPLSPTAPPNLENLSDVERRRIQEAVETFRAMGFTFNTDTLRDLLQKQNYDILSVLEMMLHAEKK